jgi:hypothetical protein
MRDAVNPGPAGTVTVPSLEAAPQRDMNLLEQILPAIRIMFPARCQPFQRRAELVRKISIAHVLHLPAG